VNRGGDGSEAGLADAQDKPGVPDDPAPWITKCVEEWQPAAEERRGANDAGPPMTIE